MEEKTALCKAGCGDEDESDRPFERIIQRRKSEIGEKIPLSYAGRV
jgi:hypothetical protein